MRVRPMRTLAHLVAALLVACTASGPRPIDYGAEPCGYCRMTITDRRFGAEVRTATGRVHTFDSIECLAAFVHAADASQLRGVWVTDFERPGALVAADSATFWRVGGGVSPMGKGLLATTAGRRPSVAADAGPLDWAAVVALVGREGLRAGSGEAHAGH